MKYVLLPILPNLLIGLASVDARALGRAKAIRRDDLGKKANGCLADLALINMETLTMSHAGTQ